MYALAAYSFWGVAPVYFVWVGFASPLEVLAHRILWALPLLALLVSVSRTWSAVGGLGRAALLRLAVCSVLLSVNWLTFIFAIHYGQIAETSLGYFINPLVSILLGWCFLSESLRPAQWLAAALAATGTLVELVLAGQLPILGLLLAFSFGFYGLVRKQIVVPAGLGLGIETLMIAPFAVAYLLFIQLSGGAESRSGEQLALLALGGVVTVLPLVWFGAAAARLPLSVLGFFQYLAPSISLVLAVAVYEETMTSARWLNLGLIWLALGIISAETLLTRRRGLPKT